MRILALIALGVVLANTVQAQDSLGARGPRLHAGKVGIGIDGLTGSSNVLVSFFLNNQLALQAIAGLDLDLPGGTASANQTKVNGVTVRGGLSLLVHLSQDQVSPYVGVEGIYQYAKQAGFFSVVPDPKNSVMGNLIFGVEYFAADRFTVGIKQALGTNVALKRDVPREDTDITLNTSTAVTARFYFN